MSIMMLALYLLTFVGTLVSAQTVVISSLEIGAALTAPQVMTVSVANTTSVLSASGANQTTSAANNTLVNPSGNTTLSSPSQTTFVTHTTHSIKSGTKTITKTPKETTSGNITIDCPDMFTSLSGKGVAMIQGFFTQGEAWAACKSCNGTAGGHLSLAGVSSTDADAIDAIIVGPVWIKSIDSIDPSNLSIALYPGFFISSPPNDTQIGALCEDTGKNSSAGNYTSTHKTSKHHKTSVDVSATAIA